MSPKHKLAYRCPDCSDWAFYLDHKPRAGENVAVNNAYFEDGSKPVVGQPILCQKCKLHQQKVFLSNIVDLESTGYYKGENYEPNT